MKIQLDQLELVQADYDDLRFGVVSVYLDNSTSKLIMLKEKQSISEEEHRMTLDLTAERLKLKHPNVLKMLTMKSDDVLLITQAYFEYPNSDVHERIKHLNDPYEFLRLLRDIISGMAFLERSRTVHGNIRPEFIFYNYEEQRYILLDRLGDVNGPIDAQRNNIRFKQKLYLDPLLFDQLIKGRKNINTNPFKSESFCFGMVALSLLCDPDELQNIYRFETAKFDFELLKIIVQKVRQTYFSHEETSLIGDFLFFCLLSVNELERLSARKAERVLTTTLLTLLDQHNKETEKEKEDKSKIERQETGNFAPINFNSKQQANHSQISEHGIRLSEIMMRQKSYSNGISDMSIDVVQRMSSLKRDEVDDEEMNNFNPDEVFEIPDPILPIYANHKAPKMEQIIIERQPETITVKSSDGIPNPVVISSKRIAVVSSRRGLQIDYSDDQEFVEEIDIFLSPEDETERNKHTTELLKNVDKQLETSLKKLKEHETLSARLNSITAQGDSLSKFSKKQSIQRLDINDSQQSEKKIQIRKSLDHDVKKDPVFVESRRVIARNAKTPEIRRDTNQQYTVVNEASKREMETVKVIKIENGIIRESGYMPLKVINNEPERSYGNSLTKVSGFSNFYVPSNQTNFTNANVVKPFGTDSGVHHVLVRSFAQNHPKVSNANIPIQHKDSRGGLGVDKNDLVLVRVENGKEVYRYRQDLNK